MSGVHTQIARSSRGRSRVSALIGVLAIVLAACGGGASASDPSVASDTTTVGQTSETSATESGQSATSDTTAADESPATTAAPSSTTDDDLPGAPDFTLELGEGGEFVLSAEPKPVYLIFWAEW